MLVVCPRSDRSAATDHLHDGPSPVTQSDHGVVHSSEHFVVTVHPQALSETNDLGEQIVGGNQDEVTGLGVDTMFPSVEISNCVRGHDRRMVHSAVLFGGVVAPVMSWPSFSHR